MAGIGSTQLNAPTFRPFFQQTLTYAGVNLAIVRTLEYVCEPENSFDNAEYLGINHIVLGVTAYVNPFATASTTNQGAPGTPGDRAGVTMANLQQVLMQKQQTLTYTIGPDVVIQAPQSPVFLSDAKLGPNPLALRVLEVHGAKTALIYFRIECYVGGNTVDPTQNNIVLSNRWSVQSIGRDNWMTDIYMKGRMRLRTDMLGDTFNPATPDIFRQAVLPLPVPAGFKRRMPNITVVPDGSELEWEVYDEQVVLNITAFNPQSGPVTVKGQHTTGADANYHDAKDLVKMSAGGLGDLLKGDVLGALWNFFMFLFPTVKNTFQFRVEGPPLGDRLTLLKIALQIVADRFAPTFNAAGGQVGFGNPLAGGLVSLYATFPIDQMAVEMRGAIAGTFGQAAASFDPQEFLRSVNIGDFGQPLGWSYSTPTVNPNPPSAGTSRGVYIGALLEAALLGNYNLPANNGQAERGANAADIGRNFQ